MNNIISIELQFYQAHRHVQLEIELLRKPNVYINVNITVGSQNRLKIKQRNILVQNLITAFNCQNEIPLDDKYGNHHT